MAGSNGLIINEAAFNFDKDSFVEVFHFDNDDDSNNNADSPQPYYSLVIVEPGGTKNNNNAHVIAIVDLTTILDFPVSTSKHYVIGSPKSDWITQPQPNNQGIPLSVNQDSIYYGNSNEWLDVDDFSMKAIFLTKSFTESIKTNLPTLFRKFPIVSKNDRFQNYLFENAIDALIVRGRNGNIEACKPIDSLVRDLETYSDTMVPRYWTVNAKDQTEATSLQRCGAGNHAYMHVDFKYELPSPWLQNPCSVVQYMEVPETPIFILPQSNLRSVPDVCGPGDLYYQTEDTDRRKFSGEKLDAYEQESKRFKASQTKLSIGASRHVTYPEQAETLNRLATFDNLRIQKLKGTAVADPSDLEHNSHLYPASFQSALQQITRNIDLRDMFNTGELPKFSEWFGLNYKEDDPASSTFYCKACVNRELYAVKEENLLSNPAGIMKRNKVENMRVLREHANKASHTYSMRWYRADQDKTTNERLDAIKRDDVQTEAHRSTILHLKLAFSEGKEKISFHKHPTLVDNQISSHLDMGQSCGTEYSAKIMQEVIGQMEMDDFLASLKASNAPSSLICDGSSDSADLHIFGCLFQYFENDVVTVRFWRAIEIDDQSAEGHVNEVVKWMEIDGILPYVKDHLASVAADGASNMMSSGNAAGDGGGFCRLLGERLEKPLFCQHCLAHRLQLILKNVNKHIPKKGILPKCPNCLVMERINNKLANFYQNSSVRKRSLHKFCKDNKFDQFTPKKTMAVRWVQTHMDSNEIIFVHYKALVLHIIQNKNNRRMGDSKVRRFMQQMEDYLKHKNFLVTLAVVLDIQSVYTGSSKAFQLKGSSIIGQAEHRKRLLLDKDKFSNGEMMYLKHLLEEATCDGVPCKTLEKFMNPFSQVVWNTILLHDLPTLTVATEELVMLQYPTTYLEDFIDGINDQLNAYMPADGVTATMNSLDQSAWPESIGTFQLPVAVKDWPKQFHLSEYAEEEFLSDMNNLIQCLEDEKNFWTDTRKSKPSEFYSALLRSRCRPSSPRLLKLLQMTLVTPFGSADAERLFSR